jgi:hypothetical protein
MARIIFLAMVHDSLVLFTGVAPDQCDWIESRTFGGLVFNFFVEGLPNGFITDEALFIGRHLTGNQIA